MAIRIFRTPLGGLLMVAIILAAAVAALWSLSTAAGLAFWAHPQSAFTITYAGTSHVDWEWIGTGLTVGLLPAGIIACIENYRHRGNLGRYSEGAVWLAILAIAMCAVAFGVTGHFYALSHIYNPYPF
jgi:hypothetical protein